MNVKLACVLPELGRGKVIISTFPIKCVHLKLLHQMCSKIRQI